MKDSGFYKVEIHFDSNPFNVLEETTTFEFVTNGRVGNHLVDLQKGVIPIVRTTTKYSIPACKFNAAHHSVLTAIKTSVKNELSAHFPKIDFNNALIEIL